jgi:hypothetical protein
LPASLVQAKVISVRATLSKTHKSKVSLLILIDSENALDEDWLKALGVDTSDSKLLKLSMAMIDDVAKTISTFMSDYKALPDGERPKGCL